MIDRIVVRNPSSSRRALAVAATLALLFEPGCHKKPPLTRESIRSLIEASEAFRGPQDPNIVFQDTSFQLDPNATKRQVLKIQGLTVKEDGPWGVAGYTATAGFEWRWTGGPLAGPIFRSTARMNCSNGPWKIYEDRLRDELWRAERGEE